jgi:hypothetical protein
VPYLARALDSAVRPLLRSAEGNETYAGPDILHAAVVLRGVPEFLAAEASRLIDAVKEDARKWS